MPKWRGGGKGKKRYRSGGGSGGRAGSMVSSIEIIECESALDAIKSRVDVEAYPTDGATTGGKRCTKGCAEGRLWQR